MPKDKGTWTVERPAKNDFVRMRISADQKRALVQAAAREGLDLSVWLRQVALRAAGLLPASTSVTMDKR